MTKIEWVQNPNGTPGETWNPISGCSKISDGCRHCFAERMFPRVYGRDMVPTSDVESNAAAQRRRRFTDVKCHPDRLDKPLRWRKPRRVFVNSMSDLFHDDVPNEFLLQVFDVMRACHTAAANYYPERHVFQILTKRPKRMRDFCQRLRWDGSANDGKGRIWLADNVYDNGYRLMGGNGCSGLTSIWLGVSVEDQKTADQRIPILLDTPAAVHWVSAEPLLGQVDLGLIGTVSKDITGGTYCHTADMLNWIVCGGESGPKARLCDVAWIRSIVEQCKAAETPVFVKQLGAHVMWDGRSLPGPEWFERTGGATDYARVRLEDRRGANPEEWPDDLRVREWPKQEVMT